MTAFPGVDASEVLRHAMRVAEFNHRLIANNVANADTPGYDAAQLDFQRTLRRVIEAESRPTLRIGQADRFDALYERANFKSLASLAKNDYNKVDIDHELAKLSENTGNYTVFSSLLAKRFGIIKNMLNSVA